MTITVSKAKILALVIIAIFCVLIAGCLGNNGNPKDTTNNTEHAYNLSTAPTAANATAAATLLPEISTNIAGEWRSVSTSCTLGDEFVSPDLLFSIIFEQDNRLIHMNYKDLNKTFVGTFFDKEGTLFVIDAGDDDLRGMIIGHVIGDEMWLSSVGITITESEFYKPDSIFVETVQLVRADKTATDAFVFSPFSNEYTQTEAYQIDDISKNALTGKKLVINGQMNGLIYGTIDQDVNGVLTTRKFCGAANYASDDLEVYVVMDENREFWIMKYLTAANELEFYTVGESEFEKDNFKTVCAVRLYSANTGSNATNEITKIGAMPQNNVLGSWKCVYTEKTNVNRVSDETYRGTISIVNQIGNAFISRFGTDNTKPDYLGGAVIIPKYNTFFMASPSDKSLFFIGGWMEDDKLYACTIYESSGVKSASVDVCIKEH